MFYTNAMGRKVKKRASTKQTSVTLIFILMRYISGIRKKNFKMPDGIKCLLDSDHCIIYIFIVIANDVVSVEGFLFLGFGVKKVFHAK